MNAAEVSNSTRRVWSRRIEIISAWGVIAMGLILRLREYLANRSLWMDEAMLSLNIVNRDFGQLFKPLDYDQGAPVGFLQLEKLVISVLGNSNELRLRLLPLAAGCAALVLFYFVLKRIFNPGGTLTALTLFAISPTLIYYSSEVKQYSTDVLITILLLYLAGNIYYGGKSRYQWPLLALSGALSIWFSHPAVFVLGGIGLVLLVQNRKNLLPVMATGAVWLASFAVLYQVSLRSLSYNNNLLDYWRGSFLPLPLDIPWLRHTLLTLFGNTAGMAAFAPALLAVTAIGAISLVIRQWQIAWSVIIPFILVLAASALQKYPISGRLMLFSVPLIFIMLGACADQLFGLKLQPHYLGPLAALALAGWLIYSPATISVDRFLIPRYVEHIRPALAHLKENYQPGDAIYVYLWAEPAYKYYATAFGLQNYPVTFGSNPDLPGIQEDLGNLKGYNRVWILFTHLTPKGFEKRKAVLDYLDASGQRTDTFIIPGTNVFLYLYTLNNPE